MVREAQGTNIEADFAEKQRLGRLALVLLFLVPVVAVISALVADNADSEAWAGAGGVLGLLFWIVGTAMGVATRRTFAGRIAMWVGLGMAVLIGISFALYVSRMQVGAP